MLTPELTQAIFFYVRRHGAGRRMLTITRRNAVHSAMFLIVSLMGVAGLYLLQQAEFLFAVQIVLYIGGIMVLFLFVIMLVNLDQAAKEKQFNGQWWIALVCVVAGGRAGVLVPFERRRRFQDRTARHPARGLGLGNTEQLADVLFKEYLLPFEIASILLLVAVVGSVVMAKKRI
jgi:NADH-quinone oxidoreductase subunit J